MYSQGTLSTAHRDLKTYSGCVSMEQCTGATRRFYTTGAPENFHSLKCLTVLANGGNSFHI